MSAVKLSRYQVWTEYGYYEQEDQVLGCVDCRDAGKLRQWQASVSYLSTGTDAAEILEAIEAHEQAYHGG